MGDAEYSCLFALCMEELVGEFFFIGLEYGTGCLCGLFGGDAILVLLKTLRDL